MQPHIQTVTVLNTHPGCGPVCKRFLSCPGIIVLLTFAHLLILSAHGLDPDGRRIFEMPEMAWVRFGDDESWSDPVTSTQGWARLAIKGPITSRDLPGIMTETFMWYRMDLPDIRFPSGGTLNIYMEGISGASRGYINGEIASQTSLDFSGRVGRFPVFPPTGFPHTFRIRSDQWNHSGTNHFALRIHRRPGPTGLHNGRALIGYAILLRPFLENVHRRFEVIEIISISSLVLALLSCVYLILINRNDVISAILMPVFLILLLYTLVHSRGTLRTDFSGYWVLPVGILTEIMSLWFLLHSVRRLTGQAGLPYFPFVLLACGMSILPTLTINYSWQYVYAVLMVVINVGVFSWVFWTLMEARKKLMQELVPVVLGIFILAMVFALNRCLDTWIGGIISLWTRPFIYTNFLSALFFMSLVIRLRLAIDGYRVLVKENLLAQESERRHIAMDLHDGIGQTLQSLKLQIQLERGKSESSDSKEWTQRALAALDSCIHELRSVAMRLRPVYLGRKPLSEALAYHAQQFSLDTGLPVTFHSTLTMDLPEEVEDHLFRIQQEALNNAHQHAKPTSIHIDLSSHDGSLIYRIENDGVPANSLGPTHAFSGSGIRNMRERAELLDGSFAIRHKKPCVQIEVMVPMRWDRNKSPRSEPPGRGKNRDAGIQ